MDINGLGKARGQDNPEVSKTRPVNTSARDKDRPAPKEEDTNSTGCPLDLQPSSEKLSAELQLPSQRAATLPTSCPGTGTRSQKQYNTKHAIIKLT